MIRYVAAVAGLTLVYALALASFHPWDLLFGAVLSAVLVQPRVKRLLSIEHFSVDGTLIEAWASMKSFRPKERSDEPPSSGGRNAAANFRGETRSNATHASTTDPDAKLYRKGAGRRRSSASWGTP